MKILWKVESLIVLSKTLKSDSLRRDTTMEVDNPGFSLRRYNINCCRILFKVLLSHKTLAGTFRDFYSRTDVALRFPNSYIKSILLTLAIQKHFFKNFLKLDELENFQSKQEGTNHLYFYVPNQPDCYIMGFFTEENKNWKLLTLKVRGNVIRKRNLRKEILNCLEVINSS